MRRALTAALLLLLLVPRPDADARAAERLDWDVEEEEAGPVVSVLRSQRDGVIGLVDNVMDLQQGIFAEGALLISSALMLASDAVGLVDDNPVTQHVTRAVASKSLAKPAYLFHVVGAEAILGSHGLETESYLEDSLAQLNPLVEPDESGHMLPLHPLDFVGDAYFHPRPQARIPGAILLSAVVADGLIRPFGNVVRIFGFAGTADRIEDFGCGLVRRAVP
ncbi:MAG: hypothetical protein JRG82_14340 [Deltaproteobacteria bacterium]|nr:hypothetical protein [Deltaproteobacteria bacterium]